MQIRIHRETKETGGSCIELAPSLLGVVISALFQNVEQQHDDSDWWDIG